MSALDTLQWPIYIINSSTQECKAVICCSPRNYYAFSCSPNLPRVFITRYGHATHEPILYFTLRHSTQLWDRLALSSLKAQLFDEVDLECSSLLPPPSPLTQRWNGPTMATIWSYDNRGLNLTKLSCWKKTKTKTEKFSKLQTLSLI